MASRIAATTANVITTARHLPEPCIAHFVVCAEQLADCEQETFDWVPHQTLCSISQPAARIALIRSSGMSFAR